MGKSSRTPAESFPPGEYVKDEMDARGWTQSDLAAVIGRSAGTVSRILSGKTSITVDTAILLEGAFGVGALYWLRLDAAWRLRNSGSRKDEK